MILKLNCMKRLLLQMKDIYSSTTQHKEMFPSRVIVGSEDSSILSLAIERHRQEVGHHYPNVA